MGPAAGPPVRGGPPFSVHGPFTQPPLGWSRSRVGGEQEERRTSDVSDVQNENRPCGWVDGLDVRRGRARHVRSGGSPAVRVLRRPSRLPRRVLSARVLWRTAVLPPGVLWRLLSPLPSLLRRRGPRPPRGRPGACDPRRPPA